MFSLNRPKLDANSTNNDSPAVNPMDISAVGAPVERNPRREITYSIVFKIEDELRRQCDQPNNR